MSAAPLCPIPLPLHSLCHLRYKAGSHRDKVTFVLLHGAGHTSLSWSLAALALSASYNVLAMDLPCHGFTSCGDASDWTLGKHAAWSAARALAASQVSRALFYRICRSICARCFAGVRCGSDRCFRPRRPLLWRRSRCARCCSK
jgi:hypothetical protein